MAWSSASLSAAELSNLAADKPLLAVNAIRTGVVSSAHWHEDMANPDRTLAAYPARRAWDGMPHLVTTPDSTSSATWYYALTFSSPVSFDCAFIMGHNFDTLSLTTIELQIADDAAYSTNLQTVGSFTLAGGDARIADLALLHTGATALRYSGVGYARLKLVAAAPHTPELGELVLGYRYQLYRQPDVPWDASAERHLRTRVSTEGGVEYVYNHYQHQKTVDARWTFGSAAEAAPFSGFLSACRGQFVWLPNPTSAASTWYLMATDDDAVAVPLDSNPAVYSGVLSAHEQGPEAYFGANE